MRTEHFHAETLRKLLRDRTVATMEDMKRALGTSVDMTVFRKLRELDYLTSYSHRGRYYALRKLARFDGRGIWIHRGIRFSQFGSLIDTVERFVDRSERGHFASELEQKLEVGVKDPLLRLTRAGRIVREEVSGLYLYCARDPARRRQQVLARTVLTADEPFGDLGPPGGKPSDEVRAAMVLFLCSLDEKRRRLYAGLESLRLGRGGDTHVAQWTGLDVHTVARGRQELLSGELGFERIRRSGGGRKPMKKKRT